MKAVKITFIVVLIVIVLVIGGVIAAVMNLGRIVEGAVETHGPQVTQTPVNLQGVNINVFQGSAQLDGFEVANPEGFSSPYVFKAKTFRVKIDPMSLQSDVIIIDEITIEGVSLVAEQKGLTTNIQTLLKSVKSFAGNPGDAQKPNKDNSNPAQSYEPKFALNNLRFANNNLRLVTQKYGEYTLEIPELTRTQLNGKGNGLTIGELGVAILQPILDEAESAAKQKLKKVAKSEVEDKLKEKLENSLNEEQKGAVNKLKGLLGR